MSLFDRGLYLHPFLLHSSLGILNLGLFGFIWSQDTVDYSQLGYLLGIGDILWAYVRGGLYLFYGFSSQIDPGLCFLRYSLAILIIVMLSWQVTTLTIYLYVWSGCFLTNGFLYLCLEQCQCEIRRGHKEPTLTKPLNPIYCSTPLEINVEHT